MATITGTNWRWFSGWGNGYHTVEVNMAPSQVVAQTWLHGASGGGTQYTGIKAFRRRRPDGSDQVVDFGGWPDWPPVISDRVSSIIFAIAAGSNQQGWAMLRIDHWG